MVAWRAAAAAAAPKLPLPPGLTLMYWLLLPLPRPAPTARARMLLPPLPPLPRSGMLAALKLLVLCHSSSPSLPPAPPAAGGTRGLPPPAPCASSAQPSSSPAAAAAAAAALGWAEEGWGAGGAAGGHSLAARVGSTWVQVQGGGQGVWLGGPQGRVGRTSRRVPVPKMQAEEKQARRHALLAVTHRLPPLCLCRHVALLCPQVGSTMVSRTMVSCTHPPTHKGHGAPLRTPPPPGGAAAGGGAQGGRAAGAGGPYHCSRGAPARRVGPKRTFSCVQMPHAPHIMMHRIQYKHRTHARLKQNIQWLKLATHGSGRPYLRCTCVCAVSSGACASATTCSATSCCHASQKRKSACADVGLKSTLRAAGGMYVCVRVGGCVSV